ncbi:aldo/keto reductase [Ectobacillus antri]|uniref:Aldo/keto reductase n=1 Tax=Ectobacillus antri TaxID=2486280 RepID=A0ABT6H1Z6_9BACI|nr:aldo/keto reductase [Ectobacillus antri]MDG4655678.1 aldo/keto reductase [Ectobacillus antri]MDG5753436.1 aldo/keto reductase [Ectobacillus antri]
MMIPTVTLHNGVRMPILGLGVWKVTEKEQLKNAIKAALDAGYRAIDTAAVYGNETEVGEAIRESGVPREELFITTKVWNSDQGYETTLAAFEVSLQKLGLDYVDLYLVHWPVKGKYVDTYRALEKLYEDGRVRAIGVSNFHIHHLEDVMTNAKVKPMVNQIELHPKLAQTEIRAFCREHGIAVEAWSPLMQGGEIFENEVIAQLAEKYGKTPAQIVLRWDVQSGIITIPKSVTPERILENSQIFDFMISDQDMKRIDALNENKRVGTNPEKYDTME